MSLRLSTALAEALQAQILARSAALDSGAAPVGWKIAASIPGVGPEEGVGGSVFGYLTSDTVQATGSRISVGAATDLCGEVELAIEIGQDLPADADLDLAATAIRAAGVALEIVDVDLNATMHDAVSGNVFHRAAALGPMRRSTGIRSAVARLEIDGQTRLVTTAEVHPARTVWEMARLLGAMDHRLQAGDRIIGGSLIHLSIEDGRHIVATIDGLGLASLYVDP